MAQAGRQRRSRMLAVPPSSMWEFLANPVTEQKLDGSRYPMPLPPPDIKYKVAANIKLRLVFRIVEIAETR
jgi:hypothetical protein